jgi:uncharacterized protein YggL (DUF469 family)
MMISQTGVQRNRVRFNPTNSSDDAEIDNLVERLVDTLTQKLAWVREGAGERFSAIELSMTMAVVVTDDRKQAAETLISARDWNTVNGANLAASSPAAGLQSHPCREGDAVLSRE